ncbi:MAG TPA: hypothetical protein VND93_18675, partial [Myxococcales bacterium]|nr:hypothetical protein [Myxococcales bacterium]
MRNRILPAVVAALALVGAACGGIVDGTGETGYKTLGTGGGEVRARDAVVTVPEGAVDQPVTFTIAPAPAEELPEGAAGLAVDVGPDASELKVPMTVQLRWNADLLPDATRPDLVWIGTVVDGEWDPLPDPVLNEVDRTAAGSTLRSGRFGVVYGCGRGRRCPVALDFASAPQQVLAGDCSAPVALRTMDVTGRSSPVQHDTTVALSADEASLIFYGDAACQRQISSLVIPARQSAATLYFRGRVSRSVTLTAQARDLRAGTQDEAILPATATASFGFVTAAQRVNAGACSAASTLAFEDAYGNRAPVPGDARVILSATSGTVTFYGDDRCLTSTSGITMPAGAASVTFWFKDDTASLQGETVTLTGAVGAFGSSYTASQD